MTTLKVVVQRDHLERLARRRGPLLSIAELIWNSLDGDATTVRVQIKENALGGIDTIKVTDNGTGIPYSIALESFKKLGASWKRNQRSLGGRTLHGQAGEGRFAAFGLGGHVQWDTRWREEDEVKAFSIVGRAEKLGSFEVSDPSLTKRRTGTEVLISNFEKYPRSLLDGDAPEKLTEVFALYLLQHTEVSIEFNGRRLDPAALVRHQEDLPLNTAADSAGAPPDAIVTVIEWRHQVERQLLLCDSSGFVLAPRPAGVQAKGFNFTAYLKSDVVRQLYEQNFLDLDELQPDLRALVDATRETLRAHFRRRAAEEARSLVQQWKEDAIYPFSGAAKSPVEEVERQVFDVVALSLNEHLPDFAESSARSKRFSLHMLKNAIEQSPNEVKRIIQEVLDLPVEKREELVELLERTTLSSIISASKVVVGRLEFLAGLEDVLFDTEKKLKLKERQHLHRLLAENTWLFGEEFNLSVDDQSLTEVLRNHLSLLGEGHADPLEPVTTLDGRTGIVDLMLSRRVPLPRGDEFEHLVVELKRPSQLINAEVIQQIEKYAFAVADDERFKSSKVRWEFWAISNGMDSFATRKVTGQSDRPDGILHRDGRITIRLQTWNQVLDACSGRLKFFRERLEYMASRERGSEHLRKVYEKYLPRNPSEPR